MDFAPYLFALGANLSFAIATVIFAQASKSATVLWINAFKAIVSLVPFTLIFLMTTRFHMPTTFSFICFFTSGLIGLFIGDWFLFKGFATLGGSRTLMLFGFQPVLLGVASLLLFHQTIEPFRLTALIFLVACLVTFSLENFKRTGHWELRGLLMGFTGVFLDACGVILTRLAFDDSPTITPFEGNFYRAAAAVGGFMTLSVFHPIRLFSGISQLPKGVLSKVTIASLSGTFLSLSLYLMAIQRGHLATVSGIAITGPLFAGIIESAIQKKSPSRYQIVSFVLFAIGFSILVF